VVHAAALAAARTPVVLALARDVAMSVEGRRCL